ncbi:MAG: hypothetical protein GYA55_02085 [SAR324 cluster bacterium]|uniref:Uncharacterized protein n=1 Tax=SAR324 cluster bacterium TaxID=2024889 RepID=A0A7X9FPK4_9DELT|nr:hypothetical protein [SAR324 cluster bacterium]
MACKKTRLRREKTPEKAPEMMNDVKDLLAAADLDRIDFARQKINAASKEVLRVAKSVQSEWHSALTTGDGPPNDLFRGMALGVEAAARVLGAVADDLALQERDIRCREGAAPKLDE